MRPSSLRVALAATLLLPLVACDDAPLEPEIDEPSLAHVEGHRGSVADVFTFDDPPVQVDGASRLFRSAHGVRVGIRTSELEPRHAYTIWQVTFNVPSACSNECGEDDLFNPDAIVDIQYVTGRIASRRGRARFRGHLAAGDDSGSLFAQLGVPAPGLVDPIGAEIHYVVRDHGPLVPGQVRDQLGTFEGACTPESSFGLGTGTYDCVDVQFAVHLP